MTSAVLLIKVQMCVSIMFETSGTSLILFLDRHAQAEQNLHLRKLLKQILIPKPICRNDNYGSFN
jgi:hypothetical protein